jgi:hypothetical protein
MRTPQYIIKIAAEDVSRLRKIDVFRVLENCRGEEVQKTAHFIRVNRPNFRMRLLAAWKTFGPKRLFLRPPRNRNQKLRSDYD